MTKQYRRSMVALQRMTRDTDRTRWLLHLCWYMLTTQGFEWDWSFHRRGQRGGEIVFHIAILAGDKLVGGSHMVSAYDFHQRTKLGWVNFLGHMSDQAAIGQFEALHGVTLGKEKGRPIHRPMTKD